MSLIPKYKVGQKVKVIKKINNWSYGDITSWVRPMNQTIGKVYEIVEIDTEIGYRLDTEIDDGYESTNYYYAEECLQPMAGQQLLFSFMEEE